jgi:hypothetical protein
LARLATACHGRPRDTARSPALEFGRLDAEAETPRGPSLEREALEALGAVESVGHKLDGLQGKPRPAGGLRWRLRRAVKDAYVRRRPKAARYWPHKKRERPPGVPKIRTATREEIRMAQVFHQCTGPN